MALESRPRGGCTSSLPGHTRVLSHCRSPRRGGASSFDTGDWGTRERRVNEAARRGLSDTGRVIRSCVIERPLRPGARLPARATEPELVPPPCSFPRLVSPRGGGLLPLQTLPAPRSGPEPQRPSSKRACSTLASLQGCRAGSPPMSLRASEGHVLGLQGDTSGLLGCQQLLRDFPVKWGVHPTEAQWE